MRITTWAEYGVICALHLAKRTELGPVNGREIARIERLPGDYVEQILLRLRRAGVITSTRGARGGYVLARPAAEISIRDVIHASELETFDLHCVSHPIEEDRCSASHNCSIRPVWVMLQQKIDDVLQSVTLADYGLSIDRDTTDTVACGTVTRSPTVHQPTNAGSPGCHAAA